MKDSLTSESSRITLREFDDSMITNSYLGWLRDPQINQYLLKPNRESTLQDIKGYVQTLRDSGCDYFLAILLKEQQRHIGNVRLGPFDVASGTCQFSMMIGDAEWHGKGLGTEVVEAAVKLCFTTLHFRKIFLEVVDENTAAIKVYEKNGFLTEGVLLRHKWINGRIHDLRIMSIFNPSVN